MRGGDGLLLGRRTYEIFAAHWPYVAGDDPIGAKFNSVRKHVVSQTLDRAAWNNSTLIKGDVVEGIKKLKREPGSELQVHGSGELIQTLLKHDLLPHADVLRIEDAGHWPHEEAPERVAGGISAFLHQEQ